MFDTAMFAVATFLLANVLIALVRLVRGPHERDRLMAVLLLGTTGVAMLAVLAHATDTQAIRDAALTLVALAVLVILVWHRRQSAAQRGSP